MHLLVCTLDVCTHPYSILSKEGDRPSKNTGHPLLDFIFVGSLHVPHARFFPKVTMVLSAIVAIGRWTSVVNILHLRGLEYGLADEPLLDRACIIGVLDLV